MSDEVCPSCEIEKIGGRCLTRWCADRHSSVDQILDTDGTGELAVQILSEVEGVSNVKRTGERVAFDADDPGAYSASNRLGKHNYRVRQLKRESSAGGREFITFPTEGGPDV